MSRPAPPDFLWHNGKIVSWPEATVHLWSEVAQRGANVFEGIIAYWDPEGEAHHVIALDAHLERLARSARMLYFPEPAEIIAAMRSGIRDLLRKLGHRETVYIRPTVYIEEGHYQQLPSDLKLGAFIVAFPVKAGAEPPPEIRCCVSSWRRTGDLAMPAAIKSGGSYLSFRFAAVEARQNGFDDAILLNERGTVAESTGAAVFAVQHGVVRTPPTTAGILDSITRRRVIDILRNRMSVPVVEAELSRQDLHSADEVFICGTLAELRSVVQVDSLKIGKGRAGPIAGGVRSEYLRQCMSGDGAPQGWITRVPFGAGA